MKRLHKILLKTLVFGLFIEIILYPAFIFLLDNPMPWKYISPLFISLSVSSITSIIFFFFLNGKTEEETPLIEVEVV